MNIERDISRDYIMSKVSPYEIYSLYMPWKFVINRACQNPLAIKDRHPSFIIGNKYGTLTHKAFNSPHSGDCINFVMQMFNLNYKSALDKIAKDFGLKEQDDTKYTRIMSEISNPEVADSHVLLQVIPKKWNHYHIDYLKQGFLEPKDLDISDDTTAFAVKSWYINKNKQYLKSDEICIAYNLKNERGDWLKIYRPQADKKDKWRTNIPFQEMHGLNNMLNCEIGIIAKSVKDAAFIKKFITPHVCVVQAEDYAAMSEQNIEFLKKNCKRIYTSFDNDEKGVLASKEINQKTGWGWINVPHILLKEGVTDWFDWAKWAGSPEPVIKHFKNKEIYEDTRTTN